MCARLGTLRAATVGLPVTTRLIYESLQSFTLFSRPDDARVRSVAEHEATEDDEPGLGLPRKGLASTPSLDAKLKPHASWEKLSLGQAS